MTEPSEPRISPSGALILEVLAARFRLGEPSWPFSTRYGSHIRRLQADGLVAFQSDSMPNQIRVRLTEEGKRYAIFEGYTLPVCPRCQAGVCSQHRTVDDAIGLDATTYQLDVALTEVDRLQNLLRRRSQTVADLVEDNQRLAARRLPAGSAEDLARLFHETYERMAPDHGYDTRKASAVPWAEVPEKNRNLMIAVAGHILAPRPQQQADVYELGRQQELMDSVLGGIWLHGSWFRLTVHLTTDEKEAFWAAIKRWRKRLDIEADQGHTPMSDAMHCWWRQGYTGPPVGREDRLRGDGS